LLPIGEARTNPCPAEAFVPTGGTGEPDPPAMEESAELREVSELVDDFDAPRGLAGLGVLDVAEGACVMDQANTPDLAELTHVQDGAGARAPATLDREEVYYYDASASARPARIPVLACVDEDAFNVLQARIWPGTAFALTTRPLTDGGVIGFELYVGAMEVTTTRELDEAAQAAGFSQLATEVWTTSAQVMSTTTIYTVEVDEDGRTDVESHEGELLVQSRDVPGSVTLPAGAATTVLPGAEPSPPTGEGAMQEDEAPLAAGWLVLSAAIAWLMAARWRRRRVG
ncbi:MAG: hypothetical protein R3185_02510, partial [Candidatus Thermoplasmatota archaeon]|nr:hypothetical protein [Candidatus Thermoplasmatota archaeon]